MLEPEEDHAIRIGSRIFPSRKYLVEFDNRVVSEASKQGTEQQRAESHDASPNVTSTDSGRRKLSTVQQPSNKRDEPGSLQILDQGPS